MGTGKQYDEEFKKQAIKLAKEIGTKAAADELCIPKGTLGTWVQKARIGEIDTGAGSRTPVLLATQNPKNAKMRNNSELA